MDDTPPKLSVVGIGASAGGIEALQAFFEALAPDLGLAYVVVVHLSPHHESELAQILQRRTKMPVREVKDSEQLHLEPNAVYVISPDRKLEISDTCIGASPFEEPRGQRAAIDVFFRSLAASHSDSFAMILSGGGSDGALGARAVKEAGGVVLVQDPREAAHEGMPRAVIAAEVADLVLPVRELAARLAEIVRDKHRIIAAIRPALAEQALDDGDEAMLQRIFELIRARTGHDFARYKRATVLRRLARRMPINHRVSVAEYLHYLKDNPEEVPALFDDLLITVTTFFRDPDAWEALRTQVIAPLVARADSSTGLRAWVPGCATGEEAYSLAMLFREEIGHRGVHIDLTIFASDVDDGALATGRKGRYPAAIGADVSAPRLERFFRAEDDHYQVTSELRDCVVFATHSALRDPPFSRLHLISCRNLLIYLDRELQLQLQGVFRYACRDDGYLFLGISESADAELFEPLDKHNRIFRVRPASHLRLPQVPLTSLVPEAAERERDGRRVPGRPLVELHLHALEALAPPSVLVDEARNAAHLSPSVGRYLNPRGGRPTHAVADLVRPELAEELRAGLNCAFEQHERYLSPFLPVHFNGSPRLVALLVQPAGPRGGESEHALVMFLEGDLALAERPDGEQEAGSQLVANLREELRCAEQRLQAMRQDHATAFEDLRAANEELQSLNEEYRSTTEELETSKEELQSVNEELQTVNHELTVKLEEVSRAHNDLENFMAATDIAMLFLDRQLGIKRYTPRVAEIVNIKPHDHGRPIRDLTHNLDYDELEQDARRVLHDLAPVERRAVTREGKAVLVRLRPYRTTEDKIDGVVLTFMD
jgi:two-component system CheB/CheR fusion protein